MIEIHDALTRILAAAVPTQEREELPLLETYGRVLAETPRAKSDVPPARVSAMDGYALHTRDYATGKWLPITQRIAAGQPAMRLEAGSAARIFTGAVIPEGANTVAIQEDCETDGQRLRIMEAPEEGQHIRAQGQDLQKDSDLFPQGHWIRAQDLGVLAAGGVDRVSVYRRLRVGILSSGDELVEPGSALQAWQIYNANRYTLHGLLQKLNMEAVHYPTMPDSLAASKTALQRAAQECDLLISSGGVSVGEEDHIKQAVEALGELALWKLRIKPGKPLAFGRIEQTPFFGLPGNPVAAFVTFLLVVRPFLLRMQGCLNWNVESERYPAAFSQNKPNSRREYLRVRVENNEVIPYRSQDSGVLSSTAWANALAVIPPDTTVAEGDLLEVIPYSHFWP